jgi:glycosyltransferase involved in cell wall biosynthesis
MKKVSILTNFLEFNPGYSLTGIVQDQVRMLVEHGHEVDLYVNKDYHGSNVAGATLKPLIPVTNLIDYTSFAEITPMHLEQFKQTVDMLKTNLPGTDIVFTHDLVFTGWQMPIGMACREASLSFPGLGWMHWVHSVPSGMRDYRDMRIFPQGHKLIYPNKSNVQRVADIFHGAINDIRVIPHIRDMRSYFDFGEESCEFIKEHPALLRADIVQVYPCSSDRLLAKRLDVVIEIFARLKTMGYSVCLVVANQWATGLQRREDLQKYVTLAEEHGLVSGRDFIVTSLWKTPKYETGISKQFLRELMQYANLFIFPTREESFGLVLAEASLASGALCVVNESLRMQLEISGHNTMSFKFGSFEETFFHPSLDEYYWHITSRISGELETNHALKLRTHMRQRFNYDYLYSRYYSPIIEESAIW